MIQCIQYNPKTLMISYFITSDGQFDTFDVLYPKPECTQRVQTFADTTKFPTTPDTSLT